MSRFVNRRDAVVAEATEKLLSTSRPGAISRLNDSQDAWVAFRANRNRSNAAIIPGGGFR